MTDPHAETTSFQGMQGTGSEQGEYINRDPAFGKRFLALETQLSTLPSLTEKIMRKHWHVTDPDKYPFWIGILILGFLGAIGRMDWRVEWIRWTIITLMVLILCVIVAVHLKRMQGRFNRIWQALTLDGELFRFLRDTGVVIGHPVEVGKPDEIFGTHLDIDFANSVRTIETYLRTSALPDPVPPDAPPSLYVPATTLKYPAGSDSHRVYEVEYRGTISSPLSIRVAKAHRGADITIGFPLRSTSAESREHATAALLVRFQDRMIAAKILSDIRDAAGVPSTPIPALETVPFNAGHQVSRAI